jgi:hypothetical protein
MEYVSNDDVYGMLRMTTEHCRGSRPLAEFQLKYRNVTYEVLLLQLSLRKQLHLMPKKDNVRSIGLLYSKLSLLCD